MTLSVFPDMVSGELGSEVTLTDTASVSVEIQLFQQPFQVCIH